MLLQESRAALAALTFLTRVPVGASLDGDDVRRAGAYFPLVGAGVGALTGFVSARRGPAVGLVLQTALTGALHLDALADSADALGTRDPERALEIMRDSRIGSFGTAALCLDLMVRSTAMGSVDDPVRVMAGAGAVSRAVPVLLSAWLPYARESGTAGALSAGSRWRALVACGLAAAISREVEVVALGGVCALASGWFWRGRLGGITGDGLGASIELTEAAVLVWSAR